MKKKLAVLLAFMMILSTMCSLNLVSAEEPDASAPIYNFVAGKGSGFSAGNKAAGKTLYTGEWADFKSGMFPLAAVADNTTAGLGGTFVITYDKSKVTLMAYDEFEDAWLEANANSEMIWCTSAHSAATGASGVKSGCGTENGRGYVYTAWVAMKGEFNTEDIKSKNRDAELGCYVFKTNDGVTVDDFDDETFKLYEGQTSAEITEGLASGGSPLSFNVKIDGNERKFGVTDSLQEREPMSVKFAYPNSTPKPVETFTVTFLKEDGTELEKKTLNVGQTLAVKDFPAVPEKAGYEGAWSVTKDITTTTTVTPVYTKAEVKPDAKAPIYNFVAGKGNGFSAGNKAAGKTLYDGEWADFKSGIFPLAAVAENTTAGLGGTFVITYDPTKVTLMAYDEFEDAWLEANANSEMIWCTSAHSAATGASGVKSGCGTENGRGYVYTAWVAMKGEFNTEDIKSKNRDAELGCYVFKTNDGVTVDDFDDETFKLYEGQTSAEITEGLASGGSPLSFNVKIDGNERKFGVTDSLQEREPMTVNFVYPKKAGPEPADEFTVTFKADGKVVKEITKKVGEKVTVSEFPDVPEKAGYTGEWDVKSDITETTVVTALYTAVSTGDVKLGALFTDGFENFDFDPNTYDYENLKAKVIQEKYVVAGFAAPSVKIEYSIDDSAYTSANVQNAFYFELERGVKSLVKIKLTDKSGKEAVYTFDVVIPAASNEVPIFETSGFEIENFNSSVREYTVTPEAGFDYVRLWGKAAAEADGDDGRTIEYAVGASTLAATDASLTYAPLAVNCGDREDTKYGDGKTENFDVNWSEKGFVNLWTEDGITGKAMFIKVTGDGNPEVGYYKISFN